ncbi:hypothetical protein AAFF_G00095880 [Aldrovandia affinis]|uniref:Uncharacterized protein n=1 Tax=Aldrovandia affinis TaxID=143900 RepID=A0AAD7RVN5_9TELE|nr:hypothetical protein AAFF_G00095880 [Aldrovandia affinis]
MINAQRHGSPYRTAARSDRSWVPPPCGGFRQLHEPPPKARPRETRAGLAAATTAAAASPGRAGSGVRGSTARLFTVSSARERSRSFLHRAVSLRSASERSGLKASGRSPLPRNKGPGEGEDLHKRSQLENPWMQHSAASFGNSYLPAVIKHLQAEASSDPLPLPLPWA